MSEAAARAYAEQVDPGDEDTLAEENPRRRAARLRRRRRLLLWGGIPAVLVIVAALWMGFVSMMTMAANHAAVRGDYASAVGRYEAVARVNPWLEQWRVHYNLGTAQLLAEQLEQADAELEEALRTAPKAGTVTVQDPDGASVEILDPAAPECLVRVNLYVTRTEQARVALEAGDTAAGEALAASAAQAAGDCQVPPPPEPDPSPTSTPSQTPSTAPTSDPSEEPSGDPSSDPSGEPSGDPSSDPSGEPSGDPSSDPSGEPSGDPTPDPTASATSESQRERLSQRNGEANGTDGGSSVSGGRRW